MSKNKEKSTFKMRERRLMMAGDEGDDDQVRVWIIIDVQVCEEGRARDE